VSFAWNPSVILYASVDAYTDFEFIIDNRKKENKVRNVKSVFFMP
jgi:hypothetical protein